MALPPSREDSWGHKIPEKGEHILRGRVAINSAARVLRAHDTSLKKTLPVSFLPSVIKMKPANPA